ncbi:Transposase IS200 like protein [Roseimaritima multifibrata]|uniref:Transposase IS200 like protein n=1 Tax=Roseimaritima multifibrata TaxID=1930274 RepID=A0A517MP47_9BACT|nr:IS200/IS605 family transposase [Roseimaritima multifibrata]QDS96655.1 Transposase IS200 like protein [Roseimaritima multifibrata]
MGAHQHLLYHIVFSTKDRRPLLRDDNFRDQTWRYMAGICSSLGGHAVRIGGHFDHAHVLVKIPAKVAVADFVRTLKSNASRNINESRNAVLKFHWQDGYGAFTVSRSQEAEVVRYIENQLQHHTKRDFKSEFMLMLKQHEIEFDERYLWE